MGNEFSLSLSGSPLRLTFDVAHLEGECRNKLGQPSSGLQLSRSYLDNHDELKRGRKTVAMSMPLSARVCQTYFAGAISVSCSSSRYLNPTAVSHHFREHFFVVWGRIDSVRRGSLYLQRYYGWLFFAPRMPHATVSRLSYSPSLIFSRSVFNTPVY